MSKFKRVLSDEEVHNLFALNNEVFCADSEGDFYTREGINPVDTVCLFEIVRNIEQAVLAKLAEQVPVVYAAFSSNGNIRLWSTLPQIGDGEVDLYPLYAHPMPCVSPASDKTACVSESGESETQTNSQGLLDSSNQEKIQIISLLKSLRLDFGAVGTRDVDVAAQNNRIDAAIKAIESHARS